MQNYMNFILNILFYNIQCVLKFTIINKKIIENERKSQKKNVQILDFKLLKISNNT